MADFRLTNFRRDLTADQAPTTPTLRLRHVPVAQLTFTDATTPLPRTVPYGETLELVHAAFKDLRINCFS